MDWEGEGKVMPDFAALEKQQRLGAQQEGDLPLWAARQQKVFTNWINNKVRAIVHAAVLSPVCLSACLSPYPRTSLACCCCCCGTQSGLCLSAPHSSCCLTMQEKKTGPCNTTAVRSCTLRGEEGLRGTRTARIRYKFRLYANTGRTWYRVGENIGAIWTAPTVQTRVHYPGDCDVKYRVRSSHTHLRANAFSMLTIF